MNIFISAGDISGDIHAARLVTELKALNPSVSITALGGKKLSGVSDQVLANIVELSGFGFWSPVRLYFTLKKILTRQVLPLWDRQRPDKVILVDYYGFNIHVAQEARRRGIPVYYYICPQVWASRKGRIKKLAASVDTLLVILPFEEEMYRKEGLTAHFVGHPILDMLPERTAPAYTPAQRPHIGFFPGSRPGAIRKHLPLLEKTAEIIRQKIDCDITVFTLPERQKLFKNSQLSIVTEQDYEQRLALNFAVTVSGTVSLEHTVMGIPMVVFYQLSRLNYYLARLLVRVKYITMANILADREVVPELIQADATPENIAHHVLSLLQSPERYTTMRNELIALRAQLGAPGAAHRAAQLILK